MRWREFFSFILISFLWVGCKSFGFKEQDSGKPVGLTVERDLIFGAGFLTEKDFRIQDNYSEISKEQLEQKVNALSDVFVLQQKPSSKELDICLAKRIQVNRSYKLEAERFVWELESFDVSSCFTNDFKSDVKVKLKMKLAAYCEGDSLLKDESQLLDAKKWGSLVLNVCKNGLYRGVMLQLQFNLDGELKNSPKDTTSNTLGQKQVKVSGKIVSSLSNQDSSPCTSQRASNRSIWSIDSCQWYNSSSMRLDVLELKNKTKNSQEVLDANRLMVVQAKLDPEKQYLQDSQAEFLLNRWQGKVFFSNGVEAPKWSLSLPGNSEIVSGVFRSGD